MKINNLPDSFNKYYNELEYFHIEYIELCKIIIENLIKKSQVEMNKNYEIICYECMLKIKKVEKNLKNINLGNEVKYLLESKKNFVYGYDIDYYKSIIYKIIQEYNENTNQTSKN